MEIAQKKSQFYLLNFKYNELYFKLFNMKTILEKVQNLLN